MGEVSLVLELSKVLHRYRSSALRAWKRNKKALLTEIFTHGHGAWQCFSKWGWWHRTLKFSTWVSGEGTQCGNATRRRKLDSVLGPMEFIPRETPKSSLRRNEAEPIWLSEHREFSVETSEAESQKKSSSPAEHHHPPNLNLVFI